MDFRVSRSGQIALLQALAAVGGQIQLARPAQPGRGVGGSEERAAQRLLQCQKGVQGECTAEAKKNKATTTI